MASRFETANVIHSVNWMESFDAATQPVFACGASGPLSKDGDPLEVLEGTVEFEHFRRLLACGLGYSDGAKGGRPTFDPVAMFEVLVVQAQHNLPDVSMGD